ncbi:hypothetical protein [Propionivibrio sp.]|uniref:hypothetical protein n=1 Tax=Propionivibrio sp. TaxID=2212460 RepID=UPI0025CF96A1|nr:hypothetical protein [Propionivibrio sp.]MBK7357268.1 hypothetical protein [Propionivibrio sp.]MBK8401335.1 hypothetical protein [Propionivibrio sp.]MBK8745995.1 hypothetical protein [Propionivibrio sp.]MBK8892561.1 hypothetical protein [Propionivibrio sp.]MBL0208688.1 hypothetical protein [Propionivibrio sp.]
MPIPASLIASIVSAIIETAAQSPTRDPSQYEIYATTRTLPPEAKTGVMLPPLGDGLVVINGQPMRLAPTAQFRSERNLIVMTMSIQKPSEVVYLTDTSGAIYRVWMLSLSESSAHQKN